MRVCIDELLEQGTGVTLSIRTNTARHRCASKARKHTLSGEPICVWATEEVCCYLPGWPLTTCVALHLRPVPVCSPSPQSHTHTPNHTHLITPRTPRHTNQTGVPIMRPLWYEFPAKEELFGVDDEFMLGPGLLVKPITHVSLTRV